MNLQPGPTLIEDRDSEILALEKELKLLEGEDSDEEEESSPLDSSQTMALSLSKSRQMTSAENVSISQNEMNAIK